MTDIVERLRSCYEIHAGRPMFSNMRKVHKAVDLHDAAAEITRLRKDREAIIRECAAVAGDHSFSVEISQWAAMTKKEISAYACKSVEAAILALIEQRNKEC